jgi:hypothetical protein
MILNDTFDAYDKQHTTNNVAYDKQHNKSRPRGLLAFETTRNAIDLGCKQLVDTGVGVGPSFITMNLTPS